MKIISRVFLFAFLLLFTAACSPNKSLSVENAWARPGTTGSNSAIYLVINNPLSEDDHLISAATDAARVVELHLSSQNESGMMMMMPQQDILIPAKGRLEFKPGSYHVMLINLNNDLVVGGSIALQLQFEKAGLVKLEVPVVEE